MLEDGNQYSIAKTGQADTFRFPRRPRTWPSTRNRCSREINIQRGPEREDHPRAAARTWRTRSRTGISPHPEIITIQQKFSIPVACLVFALVGLALGMSVARDGKLAGFVVGIAVIFAYYIVFLLAESLTKGYYANPEAVKHGGRFMARAPGALGARTSSSACSALAALIWRARYTEGGLPSPGAGDAVRRRFDAWRRASGQPASAAGAPAARPPRAPCRKRASRRASGFPACRVPVAAPDRPLHQPRSTCGSSGCRSWRCSGSSTSPRSSTSPTRFSKGRRPPGRRLTLLVYMTPQFVYYVIPIAALLSVLVTFGVLSREQRADGDEGLRHQPLPRRRSRSSCCRWCSAAIAVRARAAGAGQGRIAAPTCWTPRSAARGATPVRHHEPALGGRAATAASTTTATTTRSATR